jgi:phage terminase small subunit
LFRARRVHTRVREPPLPLNDVARAFWDRHHDRLRADGLLTDADLDTFAVLCVAWAKFVTLSTTVAGADKFREMVQLNQLLKQIHTYGREFGLFPRDRKRSKLNTDAPSTKDEFGL